MDSRIKKMEIRQFKVIFSKKISDQDTLFRRRAMKWIIEVAYITATHFAKKKMVTVSSDRIQFLLPIKSGTIAEIIGKASKVKMLGSVASVKVKNKRTISP